MSLFGGVGGAYKFSRLRLVSFPSPLPYSKGFKPIHTTIHSHRPPLFLSIEPISHHLTPSPYNYPDHTSHVTSIMEFLHVTVEGPDFRASTVTFTLHETTYWLTRVSLTSGATRLSGGRFGTRGRHPVLVTHSEIHQPLRVRIHPLESPSPEERNEVSYDENILHPQSTYPSSDGAIRSAEAANTPTLPGTSPSRPALEGAQSWPDDVRHRMFPCPNANCPDCCCSSTDLLPGSLCGVCSRMPRNTCSSASHTYP